MSAAQDSMQADSLHNSSSSLKRKRTETPDTISQRISEQDNELFQQSLRDIIHSLKAHGAPPSLFTTPLSTVKVEQPQSKRVRLTESKETESVERRVSSGVYTTLGAFAQDIDAAKDILLEASVHNGDTLSDDAMKSSLEHIGSLMKTYVFQSQRMDAEALKRPITSDSATTAGLESPQVLTLRSQTENGRPQQLYSGLQKRNQDDEHTDSIDGKRLPNGFELTEAMSTVGSGVEVKNQKVRTFAEVFQSGRKVKTLEMPRSSRSTNRGSTLSFQPTSDVLINISAVNKQDHRFQRLPAGSWLQYKSNDKNKAHDSTESLFQQAYSSFAPNSDNSNSVISEYDRNQLWWQKNGDWKLSKVLSGIDTIYPDPNVTTELSDEFADVVDNFTPVESESEEKSEKDETTALLEEVSELLETLSSYQHLRSIETPSNVKTIPSPDESSMYGVLKAQLALIVTHLPPWAVAKLNGDQLAELNVSSSIPLPASDVRGTMQPDEYTVQKARAAQPAASTVSRSVAPAQARPNSYSSTSYNATARNYNSNVTMPASSYTARPAPIPAYQTPRPPVTTTRPSYTYNSNSNYSSTPTVQQFQRPQVNGYTPYGAATPHASTQYSQRPTQTPGAATAFARVTSPTQPTMNGQPFRPSQFGQNTSYTAIQQNASAESRAIMERLKAQQQATYQAQRQTSGTPHPPSYDGTADERTSTPNYETTQQTQTVGS